jgi:predicted RNA polymerase sigma factor
LLLNRREPPNNLELDVARYFVAQHLLKMDLASEALTTIQPSLERPHDPEDRLGLLRTVRARALWQLGRLDEARHTAREAVAVERSEQMRQSIREELRDMLPE